MSLLAGDVTRRGERAVRDFDSLLGGSSPIDRMTIDDLVEVEPESPRASLATVIGLFISLAVTQFGTAALIVSLFDLEAMRLTLVFTLGAPAVLYAIIAAWDHRQLVASGHRDAAPWLWALAFPPVYLVIRWVRVNQRSLGPVRSMLAWILVQLGVMLGLVALTLVGILAAPANSAGAAGLDALTPAETARLLTAPGIEDRVERLWSETGMSGSAECPEFASTAVGERIVCTGTYDGKVVEFTVTTVDHVAGDLPWAITSWKGLS